MRPRTRLAAVLMLLSAPPAFAQQVPLYHLGEIVVAGRGDVSRAVATTRVITADQIRASGATTLDQALELLPGMNVRTGGQGVPRIDYRGLRPRHVVVLLDGVPFNGSSEGQADPSLIPLESVAEIRVTSPTGSVLYGEGGLGGVINIITRRGRGGPSGEARVEARPDQGRLAALQASAGGARLDGLVAASVASARGYPSVGTSPALGSGPAAVRANSDHRRLNLLGELSATPSPTVDAGVVITHLDGAYGVPPGVIADPTDPFASRVVYERVNDVRGDAVQLAASWDPAGPLRLRSWTFLHRLDERSARYDDSTYSSMADPTVQGTYDERSRTTLAGGNIQLELAPPRVGRLTLGLSLERDAWSLGGVVRDVPVAGSGGGGGGGGRGGGGGGALYDLRTLGGEHAITRRGVALEYQLRPGSATGLTLGWARHWLARDSLATSHADAVVAGAYHDLGPGTRIRASVARRFHFPTLRQLYDANGGTPGLATERAAVYELGVRQPLPVNGSVDVALFREDVRDYIQRTQRGGPFENAARYRFDGVEIAGEVRPRRTLRLAAALTLLRGSDLSPGAGAVPLQYRPRRRLSLNGTWDASFGLTLYAAVHHVAGQVYDSRTSPLEQRTLPAYTLTDARLSRRLHGRLSLYLGADNLFDVAYEEQYGNPQATRVLYAGAGARW